MKQFFTLLFLSASSFMIAQTTTKASVPTNSDTKDTKTETPKIITSDNNQASDNLPNPRTASSSSQSHIAVLPYDVTDKYMGRTNEFLNLIILSELPSDFPLYDPRWTLDDYNQVVDAYFIMHKEILKDKPKEKLKDR